MPSLFKSMQSRLKKQMRRSAKAAAKGFWQGIPDAASPAKPKQADAKKTRPATKQGPAKRSAKPPAAFATRRGASFRQGVHDSAHGTRSYRLYTPTVARTTDKLLPLVVMLHGCGQTPEDFARATGMNALAEEFGFLVVYPAQPRDAHSNRCWNWFRRGDQRRGAGEPALLADLTGMIVSTAPVDPARVYVAGLSAGASAALILASAYPDVFAAVGAHSGLPVGAAHDARSALVAMRVGAPGLRQTVPMPTIVFHGDADKLVNPGNGYYVAAKALDPYDGLTKTRRSGRINGGRAFTRTAHRLGRGRSFTEHWVIHDARHAWSGGNPAGSFADPSGPDASREMVRFFLQHRTTQKHRRAYARLKASGIR